VRDTEDALEKVLKTRPPLLKKSGPEFGDNALGRKSRNRRLETGKGLDQSVPKVVKLGISLSNVHVAPLLIESARTSIKNSEGQEPTFNVSTRMFHTTKAPMFVVLPLTTV
jgi:hypothetical protein